MNGFFIGARVRIKSCPIKDLVGQEGRIVGGSGARPGLRYKPGANHWHVAPDCWGTDRVPVGVLLSLGMNPYNPIYYVPAQDELEPILPAGQQAGTMTYQELMDACKQEVAKVD